MKTAGRRSVIIDGREFDVEGGFATNDDVLRLAGVIGEGIVIRIDGGRAAMLVADIATELETVTTPSFRAFRGGKLHRLRVDGVLWDWGGPAITEDEIREIAGLTDVQMLAGGSVGATLRRGGLVDLTTEWPPQLQIVHARSVATLPAVPVVVNGRSLTLEREEVTFEDLVGLAFPGSDLAGAGTRSLTVSYRRGPLARPEGSLVSREATRLTRGQIFNVTATDKS